MTRVQRKRTSWAFRAPASPRLATALKTRMRAGSVLVGCLTIFVGLALLGMFIAWIGEFEEMEPVAAEVEPAAEREAAAAEKELAAAAEAALWAGRGATQPARKALIDEMINEGIFSKVSVRASGASARVTPAFYALDFETKETLTGVILEYVIVYRWNKNAWVRLEDAYSGKEVGMRYVWGLKMK